MDFAKNLLAKYGWKEGKGLGKNEDGIAAPLKATLKFDNTGVGHEIGKDFTNKWWENVYDNAAKNIEICKDANEIQVKRVADEVEITTKDYSVRDFTMQNGNMEYGKFLKTAKLTTDGLVNYKDVVTPEQGQFEVKQLSDNDLFAICGGRTAHKGARHGLNLSGKLSRIEKQEKLLMKKLQKVKLEDNPQEDAITCKKKLKKLRNIAEAQTSVASTSIDSCNKKKKKKRKRKFVSFSETVLEYSTQEEPTDESSQGCSTSSNVECKVEIHELRINDKQEQDDLDGDDPVTTDEGIEQDCDVKNDDRGQESFSEMQVHKKEKKKKKKSSKPQADAIVDENDEDISEDMKPCFKKKKKKRSCQEGNAVIDIDGVKKIKRKKYYHRDVCDISDGLEECRISE